MPERRPVVVRGGDVVDETGRRRADVAIDADGRIAAVGDGLDDSGATVLDAAGCVVAPGLVDLHVHLREPGAEESETVATGARAAARGGFTAVLAMPNTTPTIDNSSVVSDVLRLGREAVCDVHVAGAITKDRKGTELAPMREMAELGVRFFTDDGTGVQDGGLMRRALEYAAPLGAILAQHCEDAALAADGVMHEGEWSSRLGVPGQPAEAEDVMVMRDIALSRMTGAPVHFQHLSTAGSVELVRRAKAEGLAVSAEATPHHLVLTHEACAGYDSSFRVNPPLRTPADVSAVRAAVADGTIDAIATDHAPHAPELKDQPFAEAPPGMLGLETALAVALTELDLDMAEILALMSWKPARLARLAGHGGPVVEGAPANLCVIDPSATWTVDPLAMASRSRNSPWAGRRLTGRVRHTVLAGEPVVVDAQACR